MWVRFFNPLLPPLPPKFLEELDPPSAWISARKKPLYPSHLDLQEIGQGFKFNLYSIKLHAQSHLDDILV